MLWVKKNIIISLFTRHHVYIINYIYIYFVFSRWDTHAHRLADFNYSDPQLEIYPGQDYSDARLKDFEKGLFNACRVWLYNY